MQKSTQRLRFFCRFGQSVLQADEDIAVFTIGGADPVNTSETHKHCNGPVCYERRNPTSIRLESISIRCRPTKRTKANR